MIVSSSTDRLTHEANKTLLLFLNFTDMRSEEWGKRDDIIQLNIQKLRLSSSAELCSNILDMICKVALKGQLEAVFKQSFTLSSINELCEMCQGYDNTLALRWSKTVLETMSHIALFLNTTDKLHSTRLLTSFNRCYLVFVYLAPKIVLQYQMGIIEKLISSIFETTTIHQELEYLDVSFCNTFFY